MRSSESSHHIRDGAAAVNMEVVDAISLTTDCNCGRRARRSIGVPLGIVRGVDASVARRMEPSGLRVIWGALANATSNEFTSTGFGSDPSVVDTMRW